MPPLRLPLWLTNCHFHPILYQILSGQLLFHVYFSTYIIDYTFMGGNLFRANWFLAVLMFLILFSRFLYYTSRYNFIFLNLFQLLLYLQICRNVRVRRSYNYLQLLIVYFLNILWLKDDFVIALKNEKEILLYLFSNIFVTTRRHLERVDALIWKCHTYVNLTVKLWNRRFRNCVRIMSLNVF